MHEYNIAATQMQITYRGTARPKFTIVDGRDIHGSRLYDGHSRP